MVTALTLDRFDKNRGDFIRRTGPFEYGVGDVANEVATLVAAASRTCSGEINVMNIRHQGREPAAMDEFRATEGHGPVGASVECSEERNHAVSACVHPRKFQCGFDRLGPAVGEEDFLGAFTGCNLG